MKADLCLVVLSEGSAVDLRLSVEVNRAEQDERQMQKESHQGHPLWLQPEKRMLLFARAAWLSPAPSTPPEPSDLPHALSWHDTCSRRISQENHLESQCTGSTAEGRLGIVTEESGPSTAKTCFLQPPFLYSTRHWFFLGMWQRSRRKISAAEAFKLLRSNRRLYRCSQT